METLPLEIDVSVESPASVNACVGTETPEDPEEQNNWPEESYPSGSSGMDYLTRTPASTSFNELSALGCVTDSVHYTSPVHNSLFSVDSNSHHDSLDIKAVQGVCGLYNLGNTCFMNAGLQCLFSNPLIVQFFLEKFELDSETKDTLIGKFAQLLHKYWSGHYSVIRPSDFKQTLGDYHPQFKDYRQHDCQEFLALLLDTLHEQLNTASSKSIQSDCSLERQSQSEASIDEKTPDNAVDAPSCSSKEIVTKNNTSDRNYELTVQVPLTSEGSSPSPQSSDSHQSLETSAFRMQPIPEDVAPFKEVGVQSAVFGPVSNFNHLGSSGNDSWPIQGFPPIQEEEGSCTDVRDSQEVEDIICATKVSKANHYYNTDQSDSSDKKLEKNELANKLNGSSRIPSIEDFEKNTKILNTNVLATNSDPNNEIRFDSEKFPKYEMSRPQKTVENLHTPDYINLEQKSYSGKRIKETNLLLDNKDPSSADISTEGVVDGAEKYYGINNIKRMRIDEKHKNKCNSNKVNAETCTSQTFESSDSVEKMEVDFLPDNTDRTSSTSVVDADCSQGTSLNVQNEIVADQEWEKYLSRNQSIIVDTFQGQFKSTVICLKCDHISVTYEPFMYLSLPLPHAMDQQIGVVFVPLNKKQPIRYLITLNKQDKLDKLKKALMCLAGLTCTTDIIVAEVLDNHIARILDDNTQLRQVKQNRVLFAYEKPFPVGLNFHEKASMNSSASVSQSYTSRTNICSNSENQKLPGNCAGDGCRPSGMKLSSPGHLRRSQDEQIHNSVAFQEPSTSSNTYDIIPGASGDFGSLGYNSGETSPLECSLFNINSPLDIQKEMTFDHMDFNLPEDIMDLRVNSSSVICDKKEASIDTGTEQWKSCAICLEEMMDSELLTHASCGCILCHSCIEVSCKHYGKDSLVCPVCSYSVKPDEDFVPLNKAADYKPKFRLLTVPVLYRLDKDIDGDNNKRETKLFGFPNILCLPNQIATSTLYEIIAENATFQFPYTLLLVDGQGYHCSRCIYTTHCRGCEISQEMQLTLLRAGDNLAICYTDPAIEDEFLNSPGSAIQNHSTMEQLKSQKPLSIYDCLQAFSESELLDEHNPWYCPVCRTNQCAQKTLTVWRYPETLMIYLKRFVYHEHSSTKIDNKVHFPVDKLNLSKYISGPHSERDLAYELYACVCHFGGINSGHYTAYTKHIFSSEWHYFNDELISKQRLQEEDFCNAYILFYNKSGSKLEFLLPEKPLLTPQMSLELSTSDNTHPNIEQIIKSLEENESQAEQETKCKDERESFNFYR